MESSKLAAIRTFLKPEQLHNFESLVVDRVRALEPSIRSCYDKYLDLDSDTLAWAMAIDGVFLLQLLSKYKLELPEVSPGCRKVAKDVLMMENQFPCIVLYDITNALFQPSNDGDELLSEMTFFCKSHSVFDDIQWDASVINSPRVLDLMYRLVTMRLSRKDPDPVYEFTSNQQAASSPAQPLDRSPSLCQLIAVAARSIGLTFLEFPYEELIDLFRNANWSKSSTVIEKIQIPSVSQLHRAAKIQFENSGNIGRAFRYDEDTRTLYLPLMRLNTDSEVILRNLVAYESALRSTINVASGFVDLMCGLIDTAKDVDMLKEKGIIETELASGEVAKMFNGINKSGGMVADLEQITQDIKKVYDSTFRVRFFRFVKKPLIPSENSAKLILWMVLVFLFVLQVFCQIYGCRVHWFS